MIQNADVLYPYHEDLKSRLYELIRNSERPQSPTSVERIIKASATVVNWCQRSANESSSRYQQEDHLMKFCKPIFGHLMDLVHVSMSQHARNLPAVEHARSLPAAELE